MKKLVVYLFIGVLLSNCDVKVTQQNDIDDIKKALNQSAENWSRGDIEGFMDVYWKSEKLQFIGKKGITYGWNATLNNYKKKYATPDQMGTLIFKVLSTDFLAKNLYSLTGEYYLKRNSGDLNGIFTLIFKKIEGKWVIVSDHTQ